MRYVNQSHEFLSKFAGQDPMRNSLNCIIFDHDLNRTIACDGHRLFATRDFYMVERPKAARLDVFSKTSEVIEQQDVKTPNIKQILPDTQKLKGPFNWEVPAWFSNLNKSKKACALRFSFTKGLSISLTEFSSDENAINIGLDARLIAPFAGKLVTIFACDKFTPVLITEPKQGMTNLEAYDGEWYSIIMPMRI